jgi:hypothetical protein
LSFRLPLAKIMRLTVFLVALSTSRHLHSRSSHRFSGLG